MASWDDSTNADVDDAEYERSTICPECGVSMLPAEMPGEDQVCENADCDSFGAG